MLLHGNADTQKGFLINKRLTDIHGYNIHEKTIEAVRLAKDYIIQSRGLENIVINKLLIQLSSDAHLKHLPGQDLKRIQIKKRKG